MTNIPVSDPALFADALLALNRVRTHGDTLALYLAFKYLHDELPVVGDGRPRIPSSKLEDLLDHFYEKPTASTGQAGPVCKVFNNTFTPTKSNAQNNFRDFFSYGIGVGCLAGEDLLSTDFVAEPRRECRHLTRNIRGRYTCERHASGAAYIRDLTKPKLLDWRPRRGYKVVNLNHPGLAENLKPLTSQVLLESLIIALYHDAPWSSLASVSIEQFARDFHFADVGDVEYLFSVDAVDPALRERVAERTNDLERLKRQPFQMVEPRPTQLSLAEKRVRLVAFRQMVRAAYEFTCAVCNLRVQVGERWEVQAAHIYPLRLGGTDDIRNGIALCGTHHWAFDQHMFKIERDFTITWEQSAPREWRERRVLLVPDDPAEHPDQDQALEWHRKGFRG